MKKEDIYLKFLMKLKKNGMSQTDFAKMIDISPSSLNNFFKKLRDGQGVNYDFLEKIADALDFEIIIQEKK